MDMYLSGKSVLLLSPKFYNYEAEIVKEIQNQGAKVVWLNDDPNQLVTAVLNKTRKYEAVHKCILRWYEKRLFRKIGEKSFDFVIVINGHAITSTFTHKVRIERLNPQGKMFLYYWDSLDNLKDDTQRWDDFDSIQTFDRIDYLNNKEKLSFLPLFYCEKYWQEKKCSPQRDLMIIGSFRMNRWDFVRQLKNNNPLLRINSYLYIPKFEYYIHKFFEKKYKIIKKEDVEFNKLPLDKVTELYLSSKAIIDIPMKGQKGLTIRTIEALAMHKKIITTNQEVKHYDFYSENDVFVMTHDSYKLPTPQWFSQPFGIPDTLIKRYSIKEWIHCIVNQ